MADDVLRYEDVKDWVLACFHEAEEGRTDWERWGTDSWRAYFNEYDFSLKHDWQSKVAVPVWAMGVDQASGAVKQALKNSNRLFSIEVLNPSDQYQLALARFLHDVMHELLRQAEAAVVLGDGVKINLITNLQAHKCTVKQTSIERYAPRLIDRPVEGREPERVLVNEPALDEKLGYDISVINPKNMYLDPTGRNLYRIHRVTKDRAWLSDPKVRSLYRKVAMARILDSTGGHPVEDDAVKRDLQILGTENPYRPQVEIIEYWGPIYNKRGDQVLKNRWVTLFDRSVVGLMEPYPFWHGEDPFVVGNLIKVAGSPFGKLLYKHTGGLGVAITELMCMLLDAGKFATLQGFGIDTSLLEDVEDIVDGIFPGINLRTLGPTAIQQLQFKGVDSGTFQLLGEALQMHQNYMGVTEFLQGAPSTRGRATAAEVNTKTAQSAAFFESLAGDIEDYIFEPMLEKCYWNTIQFFDNWDQPTLKAIAAKHGVTPDMLGRSATERYELLKGSFRFHAVGLSAVLRRTETMEKILRLLEVMGNRPDMAQLIPVDKLMQKVLDALDLDDLMTSAGQIPPVVAGAGAAPEGFQAIPGAQGFMAPPPGQGQPMGQMMQAR